MAYKIIRKFTAADEGKTYVLSQWLQYIDEDGETQTQVPGDTIKIIKADSSGGFPRVSFNGGPELDLCVAGPWQIDDDTSLGSALDTTTDQLFTNNTTTAIVKYFLSSSFYTVKQQPTFSLVDLTQYIYEDYIDRELTAADSAPIDISAAPIGVFFTSLNYCIAIDQLNQGIIKRAVNNSSIFSIPGLNEEVKLIKEIPTNVRTNCNDKRQYTSNTCLIRADDLHSNFNSISTEDFHGSCFLTRLIFESVTAPDNYYAFDYIIDYGDIFEQAAEDKPIRDVYIEQYSFGKFESNKSSSGKLTVDAGCLDNLSDWGKSFCSKTLATFNIQNILKTEMN